MLAEQRVHRVDRLLGGGGLLGQGRRGGRERGAQQDGETQSRTQHGDPFGSDGPPGPVNGTIF
jgi:hypothetical protein